MRNSSRGKIQGCKMPRAIRVKGGHTPGQIKDEEGAGRSVALVRGGRQGRSRPWREDTCRGEKSQGNEQGKSQFFSLTAA